jgi:hypothetical protein
MSYRSYKAQIRDILEREFEALNDEANRIAAECREPRLRRMVLGNIRERMEVILQRLES